MTKEVSIVLRDHRRIRSFAKVVGTLCFVSMLALGCSGSESDSSSTSAPAASESAPASNDAADNQATSDAANDDSAGNDEAGNNADATQASDQDSATGSITIGDEEFPFVADRQCTVFEGVANIWGSLVEDANAEVVIDVGDFNSASLGADGDLAKWSADPSTIEAVINGQTVTGEATFQRLVDGAPERQAGSFVVNC